MIVFEILSALVALFSPAPTTNVLPPVAPIPTEIRHIASPTPTITNIPTPTYTITPTKKVVRQVYVPTVTPTVIPSNTTLSNDDHYMNSVGNEVHSPAYSNSIPAGASAICGDGTYSFSQSRRGTCSHHGGVAQWL